MWQVVENGVILWFLVSFYPEILGIFLRSRNITASPLRKVVEKW
jgi:hypothetical protein